MRIGIDARFFGIGAKGLGRYTERLVRSLEKIDTKNQYYIFLTSENFKTYNSENKNFIPVEANYSWYGLKEQLLFPKLLKKYNIDLMHFPHFNVPLLYKKPFVVTIHDLIITHFPTKKATTLGPALYKIKQLGYKIIIKNAVRKAKKVITVSNFSKEDLVKYFKLPKEKVVVTYQGVEGTLNKAEEFSMVSQKYGITAPYIMYVGNAYPHKNIQKLLSVFQRVQKDHVLRTHQLVLVGKKDYFWGLVHEKAKEIGIKNVIFTGAVSDTELAALYGNAKLFVFPSLYEGFGIPPLEAMKHKTPVIASNTSSMPEILGDAAAYFDPKYVSDMTEKLIALLHDEKKLIELKEKGKERVGQFSSIECARKTLLCYDEVAQSKA